jgi:hypothetical protein
MPLRKLCQPQTLPQPSLGQYFDQAINLFPRIIKMGEILSRPGRGVFVDDAFSVEKVVKVFGSVSLRRPAHHDGIQITRVIQNRE